MKNLIFFLLIILTIIFTGCGSDDESPPAGISAKIIPIDESSDVAFRIQPKRDNSIMNLIIPKAIAASFSGMKPFFSPYYQTFPLPNNKYDCQSFTVAGGDAKISKYCTETNMTNLNLGDTAVETKQALKDAITLYPRIAHADYDNDGLHDTESVANLIENKFYHFNVARLGGGV